MMELFFRSLHVRRASCGGSFDQTGDVMKSSPLGGCLSRHLIRIARRQQSIVLQQQLDQIVMPVLRSQEQRRRPIGLLSVDIGLMRYEKRVQRQMMCAASAEHFKRHRSTETFGQIKFA